MTRSRRRRDAEEFNLLHGELEDEDEQYQRPGYAKRNVRVGDAIGGDLIGGTIYELEAGERVCPYHYHHGVEEWLYVVAGEPTLRQPDGERALRPGDVVCFPWGPEGAHTVTALDGCCCSPPTAGRRSRSTPTATRSAPGRRPTTATRIG